MRDSDPQAWMWSEAIAMLARAERLHRQFFQPRHAAWEPPVDVLEQEREVVVLLALPGVNPDHVETAIVDGSLVIAGRRVLPPELRTGIIHRLELPQGRFERRVPLPPGRYSAAQCSAVHGCLMVRLQKLA